MKKSLTGLIVLSMVSLMQVAGAYEMESLEAPLPAISGVSIKPDNLRKDTDFHATLSEQVAYKKWTLPEGTEFIGYVQKIERANPVNRSGSLDIWVHKVVFPNGKSYVIYPNEQVKPNFKFRPRVWDSKQDVAIDAGTQIQLKFSPSTMKGMMETSKSN